MVKIVIREVILSGSRELGFGIWIVRDFLDSWEFSFLRERIFFEIFKG